MANNGGVSSTSMQDHGDMHGKKPSRPCENCGAEILSEARICPQCGKARPRPRQVRCRVCGTTNPTGQKECRICAAPLQPAWLRPLLIALTAVAVAALVLFAAFLVGDRSDWIRSLRIGIPATEPHTGSEIAVAVEATELPPTTAASHSEATVPTVAPAQTSTSAATSQPDPTASPTAEPTLRPSSTPPATNTPTPPPTATQTATPTRTPSPSPPPTRTATPTLLPSATATETYTPTPRPSATRTPAPTSTPAPTTTPSPAATATDAPTSAPTPPPSQTPSGAPTPFIYTIKAGDNLYNIALEYNTSVAAIMAVNGLQSNQLRVGQQLIIPVGTTTPQPVPTQTPTPEASIAETATSA